MTDTTARILAKGCESTGITEDIARKLFDKGAGSTLMAVVELRVVRPHGPDTEDKRSVDLQLLQVHPAWGDQGLEDHLRNLTRSMHNARQMTSEDGQTMISTQSDVEPTVEEVTKAGKMHEPHEYVQAPDKADGQGCDVCGNPEFAKVHDASEKPEGTDAEPAAPEEE